MAHVNRIPFVLVVFPGWRSVGARALALGLDETAGLTQLPVHPV